MEGSVCGDHASDRVVERSMKASARKTLHSFPLPIFGFAVALTLGEAFVRLWWSDAPAVFRSQDQLMTEACQDGPAFCLKKNASGYDTGQWLETDARGLRKGPGPAGRGKPLTVLMAGDSMVFGTGVDAKDNLPARLQEEMSKLYPDRRVWVANAGVPGYNPAQALEFARMLADDVKPDLILFSLIHNDLDRWGIRMGSEIPQVRSVIDAHPKGAPFWMSLYHAMLPHDPADKRWALANRSRLYLYVALALRRFSWGTASSRVERNPAFNWSLPQLDRVVWEPLGETFRGFDALARAHGGRAGGFIYTDFRMDGIPIRNLRRRLDGAGVPYLDLSPAWRPKSAYARRWTLGWDPHPNAAAHRRAAGLLLRWAAENGLAPKPGAGAERLPKLDARTVRRFEEEEDKLVQTQEKEADEFFASLPSEIVPGKLTNLKGEASLYGWWSGIPSPPGRGSGQWTGPNAGVLLGKPSGPARLSVSGWTPQPTPARLTVRIDGAPVRPPFILRDRAFLIQVPVEGQRTHGNPAAMEVQLDSPDCRPRCEVEDGTDDCRLLCLHLERIEVREAGTESGGRRSHDE